jgi:hypothetical protein
MWPETARCWWSGVIGHRGRRRCVDGLDDLGLCLGVGDFAVQDHGAVFDGDVHAGYAESLFQRADAGVDSVGQGRVVDVRNPPWTRRRQGRPPRAPPARHLAETGATQMANANNTTDTTSQQPRHVAGAVRVLLGRRVIAGNKA